MYYHNFFSMIPTGAIFHDMELPSCGYTVRGQTHNGPLIRSAKVGDQVFHRWECYGNNGDQDHQTREKL